MARRLTRFSKRGPSLDSFDDVAGGVKRLLFEKSAAFRPSAALTRMVSQAEPLGGLSHEVVAMVRTNDGALVLICAAVREQLIQAPGELRVGIVARSAANDATPDRRGIAKFHSAHYYRKYHRPIPLWQWGYHTEPVRTDACR
jgi:hypothetical protein